MGARPRVTCGAWVLFSVSLALFLGFTSKYFGGNSLGEPPSLVRSVGIPNSPWLVAQCTSFEAESVPTCGKWAYSAQAGSWSWLALALALGTALKLGMSKGSSGAKT